MRTLNRLNVFISFPLPYKVILAVGRANKPFCFFEVFHELLCTSPIQGSWCHKRKITSIIHARLVWADLFQFSFQLEFWTKNVKILQEVGNNMPLPGNRLISHCSCFTCIFFSSCIIIRGHSVKLLGDSTPSLYQINKKIT